MPTLAIRAPPELEDSPRPPSPEVPLTPPRQGTPDRLRVADTDGGGSRPTTPDCDGLQSSTSGRGEELEMELPARRPTITRMVNIEALARRTNQMVLEDEMPLARKVWIMLEEPTSHAVAKKFHAVYNSLIFLSVASIIVRTLPSLQSNPGFIQAVEYFFNITFSVEVLVRSASSPSKASLLKSVFMWMDTLAVVPFWILIMVPGEDGEARSNMWAELMTLTVPVLRLLKITRHSAGWRLLVLSISRCARPLLVPGFLLMLMTVFASCLLFWMEKHAACKPGECKPGEVLPGFTSVPQAMWFAVVSVATIGYGDVYPKTEWAKVFTVLLVLAGVCYMAMPLAIIGNTFTEVWEQRDLIMLREKTASRLAAGGVHMSDIQMLWEACDEDGNGLMELDEFVRLVDAFQLGLDPVSLRKLFRSIDTSGDGLISFEEFASFVFPEVCSEHMIREALRGSSGSTSSEDSTRPPTPLSEAEQEARRLAATRKAAKGDDNDDDDTDEMPMKPTKSRKACIHKDKSAAAAKQASMVATLRASRRVAYKETPRSASRKAQQPSRAAESTLLEHLAGQLEEMRAEECEGLELLQRRVAQLEMLAHRLLNSYPVALEGLGPVGCMPRPRTPTGCVLPVEPGFPGSRPATVAMGRTLR